MLFCLFAAAAMPAVCRFSAWPAFSTPPACLPRVHSMQSHATPRHATGCASPRESAASYYHAAGSLLPFRPRRHNILFSRRHNAVILPALFFSWISRPAASRQAAASCHYTQAAAIFRRRHACRCPPSRHAAQKCHAVRHAFTPVTVCRQRRGRDRPSHACRLAERCTPEFSFCRLSRLSGATPPDRSGLPGCCMCQRISLHHSRCRRRHWRLAGR